MQISWDMLKKYTEKYRQPIISRDILNITQHLEAAHGYDFQSTEESFNEDSSNNDEEDIREENIETAINEGINYQIINCINNVNFM